jgi:very-short-patch-repair endonuclease
VRVAPRRSGSFSQQGGADPPPAPADDHGLPSIPRLLLDRADRQRRARARRGGLPPCAERWRELRAICGYGREGSTTLKQAIRQHTPELAQTKSKLERAFHALCGRAGIPPYKLNYRLCGITVDAFWPDLGVVVELDGVQGHASPAQMRRDHHRDLMLRAASYIVVRYSYDQVTYEADTVVADLRRVLDLAARRGASAAATS